MSHKMNRYLFALFPISAVLYIQKFIYSDEFFVDSDKERTVSHQQICIVFFLSHSHHHHNVRTPKRIHKTFSILYKESKKTVL